MRFSWSALEPRFLAVLRIGAGALFMQHGLQKLFGMLKGNGLVAGGETVPLVSLMGLAGVLELVGGILLILGLLTRPTAFILAGQMAVAYLMAHASRSLFPIENQGEPALLFMLIFLYISAAGPGALAIDNALRLTHRRVLAGPEQPRETAGQPVTEHPTVPR